jgi:hypothetical protein
VLHLAHRWDFSKIRGLAIGKLAMLAEPVDRVVLAHAYAIPQWLAPAYQALCVREACLSDEEGAKLGLQDVLKIARTHSAMHTKGAKLDGTAQLALVNKVFGLGNGLPTVASESKPALSSQVDGTAYIVPASALPPPLNKHNVTLAGVSIEKVRAIQDAVAAVVAAQNEAKLIKAVFEPLAQAAQDDINEAESSVPPGSMFLGRRALIDEQVRVSNRHIRLYNTQIRAAEAKVSRAQAAVASLLSQ